jgi:hypothetical protein
MHAGDASAASPALSGFAQFPFGPIPSVLQDRPARFQPSPSPRHPARSPPRIRSPACAPLFRLAEDLLCAVAIAACGGGGGADAAPAAPPPSSSAVSVTADLLAKAIAARNSNALFLYDNLSSEVIAAAFSTMPTGAGREQSQVLSTDGATSANRTDPVPRRACRPRLGCPIEDPHASHPHERAWVWPAGPTTSLLRDWPPRQRDRCPV